MTPPVDTRRYDIDWLRTLAFVLLIFYHIGQFYVTDWDWHVKSAYTSDFLKNIMLLVNQWRMPLIFLVSGVALALVEPKIGGRALLKMRFVRVFIPLVIGMYLIVPPQLFFELIQSEGYAGSYWEFWGFYVDSTTTRYPSHQHGPIGLVTWNHLWYLAYLWHYTLVYLVIKPLLIRMNGLRLGRLVTAQTVFLVPVVLFVIYSVVLEPRFPQTNALIGDWYNHAFYFTSFMMGYVIAKSPSIWNTIVNYRKVWLALALVSYSLVIIRFNGLLGFDLDYNSASIATQLMIECLWAANKVLWLFAVVGFAAAHLNQRHPVLSYMNEAVLPWYILHQTLIVIFAMGLATFELGPIIEPVLLITATFLGCFVGYELIKRFSVTRFMFGLKRAPAIRSPNTLRYAE